MVVVRSGPKRRSSTRQIQLRQKRQERYRHTEKGVVTTLLKYARYRAKKRGLPFDIDTAFVTEKLRAGVCEVTGIRLEYHAHLPHHRHHPWSPSLDRIDSSKGYTRDNVRLVAYAVNIALSNWGEEVLTRIAFFIARNHLR